MGIEESGYKSVEELKLHNKVLELYGDCLHKSPLLRRFFDKDSHELLKEKREVLQKIKDGKSVSEDEFYGILENYPKENTNWDI